MFPIIGTIAVLLLASEGIALAIYCYVMSRTLKQAMDQLHQSNEGWIRCYGEWCEALDRNRELLKLAFRPRP